MTINGFYLKIKRNAASYYVRFKLSVVLLYDERIERLC